MYTRHLSALINLHLKSARGDDSATIKRNSRTIQGFVSIAMDANKQNVELILPPFEGAGGLSR
jgi:hypothetical protein